MPSRTVELIITTFTQVLCECCSAITGCVDQASVPNNYSTHLDEIEMKEIQKCRQQSLDQHEFTCRGMNTLTPDVIDIEQLPRFLLLSKDATNPTKSSPDAAGFDLYASEEVKIEPGESRVVLTDVEVCPPKGTFGKIESRSGLAFNHGVTCFCGIIDSDYRGSIKVKVYNDGKEPFNIRKGERFTQLVFYYFNSMSSALVTCLPQTQRGYRGFGSTGM
jgi:dUTP pyrophosphatase